MKILDVLSGPWAIEPGKLLELQAIYASHVRGEQIDIAAVEARLGRPLANEQRAYDIVDGVAIISIEGVVAKKMNMFSQISGGASSQLARQSLNDAKNDPAVHSIIQYVDSPGGTVDGTQTYAETVFAAREAKPIVTLGSGVMASAAYWFGSASSAVYIADGTTSVGSIGIVAAHQDISAAEASRGIKTTELTAGKFKRVASQYAPLSEDGRQSIQAQLDYMYSMFVGDVAKYRGVSGDVVLRDMAEGRMFTGQQALDAGLVDGIMSLEALVEKLNQDRGASGRSVIAHRAGPARTTNSPTIIPKGSSVTKDEIEAQHPALAAELRADGAAAERSRIQAIEAQVIPGHEALINTLKFDGKSTGGDAAMAVLAAEKVTRTAHATAAANEAPKPLAMTPPPAVAQSADEKKPLTRVELDAKAKEHMAANPGVSYVAAVKHIQQGA